MDEGRKAVKKVAGEKKFKHINIQRSTETLTPSLIWRKDYFSKYGKKKINNIFYVEPPKNK